MTTLENLFAQWQAMEAYSESPEISDKEGSEACNAASARVHEMLCIPAASAADLARKIIAFTSDGIFETGSGKGSDVLWTETSAPWSSRPVLC